MSAYHFQLPKLQAQLCHPGSFFFQNVICLKSINTNNFNNAKDNNINLEALHSYNIFSRDEKALSPLMALVVCENQ